MIAKMLRRAAPVVVIGVLIAGCGAAPDQESTDETAAAVSGASIADIARANLGEGPCSRNSYGQTGFFTSCSGEPTEWCSDFSRWVWYKAGVKDTGELTPASGSFYTYGQRHGTMHSKPKQGDAVVFDYHGGGSADHVAIVSWVYANGDVNTISGNWGDRVERNGSSNGGYPIHLGVYSPTMGMTPSAFVGPVM